MNVAGKAIAVLCVTFAVLKCCAGTDLLRGIAQYEHFAIVDVVVDCVEKAQTIELLSERLCGSVSMFVLVLLSVIVHLLAL